VDGRGKHHFIGYEVLEGLGPVPLDRLDELDDVEEEVSIRIHRATASAWTLSRSRGLTSVPISTG